MHKKTDKIGSEFIAKLALNDIVQPSRVFPKTHREYRLYIRLRHKLVQKRMDVKNEAHAILVPEMFNLKDVLTDIFGKNGREILSGISAGKNVYQILQNLSPNVRKKSAQIRELLDREISQRAMKASHEGKAENHMKEKQKIPAQKERGSCSLPAIAHVDLG